MIIPIESLPKIILLSTIVAELFLVAIPILMIMAYRQVNSMASRSLWLGMGLALATCLKFLFLMKQQLFANWEPLYSVSIIVIVEAIVREWIVRHWSQWESHPIGVQFIMGYLFAKLLGIGTIVFFFFILLFARIAGRYGLDSLTTGPVQQFTPYTQLVLHSLFNLGYMLFLFVLILLRIRLVNRPRWNIALLEFFFFSLQGFLLILMNNVNLPTAPLFFAIALGTLGLGYFGFRFIYEPRQKPSIAS